MSNVGLPSNNRSCIDAIEKESGMDEIALDAVRQFWQPTTMPFAINTRTVIFVAF